jgi:flagellar protein FliS
VFGFGQRSANAYSQIGVETSVQTADPFKLILLLFEGARDAILIARSAMEANQIEARGTAISKAIDIITNGLKASLDLEQGGALAEQLSGLYEYMTIRLLHANMNNDKTVLDEVLMLLEEIHSAWREIPPEERHLPR